MLNRLRSCRLCNFSKYFLVGNLYCDNIIELLLYGSSLNRSLQFSAGFYRFISWKKETRGYSSSLVVYILSNISVLVSHRLS